MAHAAARRGGAAGNEADDRLAAALLRFVGKELRGFFLRAAADLADHHDGLGLVIREEHVEHVDEVGAVHRIAADADRRGLPEADLRGLVHRFVSQRAGARDDADAALGEDGARHDADLAFAGGENAGAVRPDQARPGAFQRGLHAHHVEHRNALCDGDDQLHLGIDRLADRIGGEGRGDVDA